MKENQRVTITKRMLKEGLLRLLGEKPLDKIRVNELCGESGINRATFYRYYQRPQDVLAELEMDLVKEVAAKAEPPKCEAEAKDNLARICAFLYERADVVKILFRCNTDVDMMAVLNEHFRQLWELKKDEPRFAKLDKDTARAILALVGGGSYCLLRQWILEEIPKTPEEIAEIICNVIRWPAAPGFLQN